MYKQQITQWVEAHRDEMLEDIKTLLRIRMPVRGAGNKG